MSYFHFDYSELSSPTVTTRLKRVVKLGRVSITASYRFLRSRPFSRRFLPTVLFAFFSRRQKREFVFNQSTLHTCKTNLIFFSMSNFNDTFYGNRFCSGRPLVFLFLNTFQYLFNSSNSAFTSRFELLKTIFRCQTFLSVCVVCD